MGFMKKHWYPFHFLKCLKCGKKDSFETLGRKNAFQCKACGEKQQLKTRFLRGGYVICEIQSYEEIPLFPIVNIEEPQIVFSSSMDQDPPRAIVSDGVGYMTGFGYSPSRSKLTREEEEQRHKKLFGIIKKMEKVIEEQAKPQDTIVQCLRCKAKLDTTDPEVFVNDLAGMKVCCVCFDEIEDFINNQYTKKEIR